MLSRRTDLTEHSDFGDKFLSNSFFISDDFSFSTDGSTYFSRKLLSKSSMVCERDKVFRKPINHYFLEEYSCHRCGKTLSTKWCTQGNLCQKCDDELEIELYGKFPWERGKTMADMAQEDPMDIFNLK